MFERFTEKAKKVMNLADQEAQRWDHEYVDTSHMLIALLKEGSGIGATVLKNLGADLLRMRSELKEIDIPCSEVITTGRLPQTPQAKKAIEYALEEARRLKYNYVGTEHILLGLLRQPEKGKFSTANKILRKLEIKPKEVREEVMNLLGKEERPVKCKFFQVKGSISPAVEFVTNDIVSEIEEFLNDGKELVEATQSSVVYGHNIITKIIIFYRDKK